MTPEIPPPLQWVMAQHIEWLCEGSWCPHRYEIAWGPPDKGPTNARTFDIDNFYGGSSLALDVNLAGNNVYVGMTIKGHGTPHFGRTSREHALLATCMVLDFDHAAGAGLARLGSILCAPLLVITGSIPEHRVQAGIRLVPTQDLDRWAQLIKAYAEFSGADLNAVGVNRLVRLAGTISYPSPAKQARGYIPERTGLLTKPYRRYTLDKLEQLIPGKPLTPSKKTIETRSTLGLPLTDRNARNVVSALQALPSNFADEYSKWLEVGFALHDFDSGPVGLALWTHFSHRCPLEAAKTDFPNLWAKFDTPRNGPKITIGTLLHHAKASGWHQPHHWDRPRKMRA